MSENVENEFGNNVVDEFDDVEKTVESMKPQAKNTNDNSNRKDLKTLACEHTHAIYDYAALVKKSGHATLADMIFREAMTVNLAANMASEAIGRDRFISFLEDGYYSSGKVMEYLKFLSYANATSKDHGALFDDAMAIHKIFAASIKTATNKKPTVDEKL